MLNHIDVSSWTPFKVKDWLVGLCDDVSWLCAEVIFANNIGGRKLLLMTAQDLRNLGATKVDLQEQLSEAIERLRFYNFSVTEDNLQASIFRLACQSRGLHRQLVTERTIANETSQNIVLSTDFEIKVNSKQRISLDTLSKVSNIVTIVKHITDVLNSPPFSKHGDYRSMKSLILALSIELTSTAQRDQFVEKPNDIIEKSSKALADYCDRIVHGTRDPLMIQPFLFETVRIKKNSNENDFGLVIKSSPVDNIHIIDKILPLSPAKKTNKLNEGDEVLQFNQFIVGWSAENVKKLISASVQMSDIILMVKKRPMD